MPEYNTCYITALFYTPAARALTPAAKVSVVGKIWLPMHRRKGTIKPSQSFTNILPSQSSSNFSLQLFFITLRNSKMNLDSPKTIFQYIVGETLKIKFYIARIDYNIFTDIFVIRCKTN